MSNEQEAMSEPRCSFCARPHDASLVLIEGPDKIHICEDCVDTCVSYLPLRPKLRILATLLSPWWWLSRRIKPSSPRPASV